MPTSYSVEVIINQNHKLMPEQEQILNQSFPHGWWFYNVPASGWSLEDIKEVAKDLSGKIVVFVSPVPYLIKLLSLDRENTKVFIFHNHFREKKELGNGKIIHTVASTGWQLV